MSVVLSTSFLSLKLTRQSDVIATRESLEISGRDGTVRVDGFVLVSTAPWTTPADGSRQPTSIANSYRLSTGMDRVIDGQPSGERTTTFKINQQVSTPMPLSQEAEMMKTFSEVVTTVVSDCTSCTGASRPSRLPAVFLIFTLWMLCFHQGTERFAAEQLRWSKYILDTQTVLDAVLSSLRAGGVPVQL